MLCFLGRNLSLLNFISSLRHLRIGSTSFSIFSPGHSHSYWCINLVISLMFCYTQIFSVRLNVFIRRTQHARGHRGCFCHKLLWFSCPNQKHASLCVRMPKFGIFIPYKLYQDLIKRTHTHTSR